MADSVDQTSFPRSLPRLTPGYLLAPFGWVAVRLAPIAAAEPALFPHLFALSRPRMHLLALALAHLEHEASPALVMALVRESFRTVVTQVLGRCPARLRRAVSHMPSEALQPESYRHLIEVLDDSGTARLLFHAESVDDSTIRLLYDVPAALRRPLLAAVRGRWHRLDRLTDGLRYLACRGGVATFDDLVADLASVRQPAQFVAKLKQIAAELPLPDSLPPAQIGSGRRLDRRADLCALAKRWQNCLAMYANDVDTGGACVYLWEDTSLDLPPAWFCAMAGSVGSCTTRRGHGTPRLNRRA
jgi:hypothetical protein